MDYYRYLRARDCSCVRHVPRVSVTRMVRDTDCFAAWIHGLQEGCRDLGLVNPCSHRYVHNRGVGVWVAAWTEHYASWAAAAGLGSKITAFVVGAANMIAVVGIPKALATVIMGVFVASFAATTLDTATRVQRYVVAELFGDIKLDALAGRYPATFIAVATAMALAFITGADGNGALKLWPLFGAVNQTLAALALIIIALYLKGRGGTKWMIAGLPAIFMSVMTIWALVLNQLNWLDDANGLLTVINICVLVVAVWILIEGVMRFFSMSDDTPSAPDVASG